MSEEPAPYHEDREFEDDFADLREHGFTDIYKVFAEMEKVLARVPCTTGGLTGLQRRSVQQALLGFVFFRPLPKDTLNKLKALEEKSAQTVRAIALLGSNELLVLREDVNLENLLDQLISAIDACDKIIKRYGPRKSPGPGRPRSTDMAVDTMYFLELEWENTTDMVPTGVSQTTDERESHFVDFAIAAFEYVPEEFRPVRSALMVAWQRHVRERKKSKDA